MGQYFLLKLKLFQMIFKNSLKTISFSEEAKPKTSGYGRKMLHCELGNVVVILLCMKTQKTMQIPQICN